MEAIWPPLVQGFAKLVRADAQVDMLGLYTTNLLQAGVGDPNSMFKASHVGMTPTIRCGVGGNMPKVRQFVIFPKLVEVVDAIDLDQLSSGDLVEFNAFVLQLIELLPGAHTLYLPMGSMAKHQRAVPLLLLSCVDHAAAVRTLDTESVANTMDICPSVADIAIDITQHVLSSVGTLSSKPFKEILRQDDGIALWSYLTHLMEASAVRNGVCTDFDDLANGPATTPAYYEVQIRDVHAHQPRFVLRTAREHLGFLTSQSLKEGDWCAPYPAHVLEESTHFKGD